jgi:uncharacterized protein (DUF849 family)
MLLKIAMNGARSKTENENIPRKLDEIKNDTLALFNAGCRVFHIHCYDEESKESIHPDNIKALVNIIKNISHEIKLGISTGDWIEPDIEKRMAYIKEWYALPDFASVNMIEDGAVRVANTLIEKGVAVEAGLNNKEAAAVFINSPVKEKCIRILIEPEEEDLTSALSTINEVEEVLNSQKIKTPRLLHGFNSVSWALLKEAEKRGYDGRIGLEDTVYLPKGEKASGNLEVYKQALSLIDKV